MGREACHAPRRRADPAPPRAYARAVAEDLERPRASWSFRLIGLAVVVVVAWVVLFPLLNIAASLLALALYVIIAFVAYQVGKAVGRASRD
jgi:uncharacterized protein YacL